MSYTHFTPDDRVKLAVLIKTGAKREEISLILSKNPISIWREIKRGSRNGRYLPSFAKIKARKRKTHRKKKIAVANSKDYPCYLVRYRIYNVWGEN